jgi:hypothetical protein
MSQSLKQAWHKKQIILASGWGCHQHNLALTGLYRLAVLDCFGVAGEVACCPENIESHLIDLRCIERS